MNAEVLNFKPIFKSVRLEAGSAPRAFPLVQLYDPHQSVPGWTQFVRSQSRTAHRGVNAIADQRGYLHALFVWNVDRHLTWRRVLRVSSVVLAALPGCAVQHAVIRAMRDLAGERECEAILIEPGNEHSGLGRNLLQSTGFLPLSESAFVQRLDQH